MQIKKLEYVANQRTIIKASTDKGPVCIKFTDIRPFWPDAKFSSLEGGKVLVSGTYLIFTMLVASGQGGVVCVWDCESNKLVHISDGAYCVSAAIDNGKLYTLHDISHYCMPYHLRVFSCPFGTMDASAEGTPLYADAPVHVDHYPEAVSSAELLVKNGRIDIVFGNQVILFAADEAESYKLKEEYASYYQPAEKSMDPALLKRKGMLL